ATAGSPAKLEACKQLGADLVLNYKTDPLESAVKQFAPQGVNIWWENSRQPDFDRAISMLGLGGKMILMAGRDARPPFPVGPFYVKDCSLIGFAMFNATPAQIRAAADQINEWLATGKLKARIDRVLPLSEAALAHRLQEESTVKNAGTVSGKIVLRI
ncbi:MAG: zinc-binding dehydrogenase, partial [Verrucomicrobiae bacterium]|nr:zinc-binding dehydrogenase [Verrucomicrobiae bacterium]